MLFPSPLLRGTLLQRYKRFLADVKLDTGETVTATCPNTGSMKGLTAPGSIVWLSTSDSPTRKYRHTWELTETDLGAGPTLVGINTGHPNGLVAEAIATGRVAALAGYGDLRREVRYGESSRIDILLKELGRPLCFVEVKNVHLSRRPGLAEKVVIDPRHDLEQRRFPGSVGSQDADFGAGEHRDIDAFEDLPARWHDLPEVPHREDVLVVGHRSGT